MEKDFQLRFLMILAIALGVSTLFSGEAFALHKAPDEAGGEQPQDQQAFNQILQERNIARDRARDRLMEKSQPQPVGDASVTVKIRHRDENTDANSRGEVIAEMKVSKDDIANGNSKDLYSKVKASAGSNVISHPATSRSGRRDRILETTVNERRTMWMLGGLVGLGLFGWWYIRRFQPI